MGIFKKRAQRGTGFGEVTHLPDGSKSIQVTLLDGDEPLAVVGESYYQDALLRICGGTKTSQGFDLDTTAILIPDFDNKFDPNAVSVFIDGEKVGHLSRDAAEIAQPALVRLMQEHSQPIAVRAVVKGGWDRGTGDSGSFGVVLFVDPDELS